MDMLLCFPGGSRKPLSSTAPFQTRTYLPLLRTPVWPAAAQAPQVLASPSFLHMFEASRKEKSVCGPQLIPKLLLLKYENHFNHHAHSCKYHTFTPRPSDFQGRQAGILPTTLFISDAEQREPSTSRLNILTKLFSSLYLNLRVKLSTHHLCLISIIFIILSP